MLSRKTHKRTLASRIAEWSILAALAIPGFSGVVFGETKLYVANLPMPVEYFFLLLSSVLILSYSATHKTKPFRYPLLLISVSAFLWMLMLGIISNHDLKWIVIDCFQFGGLVIGTMWATRVEFWDLIEFAGRLCLFGFFTFILGILCAQLGFGASATEASSDLENYSLIWLGAGVFSFFLPTLYLYRLFPRSQRKQVAIGIVFWSGPIIACSAALYLVNRSMLLIAFFNLAIIMRIISLNKIRSIFICLSIASASLLVMGFMVNAPMGLDLIGEFKLSKKMSDRSVWEDPRAEEVVTIIGLLKDKELTGLGFGSRYPVTWISWRVKGGEEGLTYAPHLGAFAFLQKGGYPVYMLFVLAPFLFAAYGFLRLVVRDEVEVVLWGQVLLYLVMSSCASGGWTFIGTFFYGAFFTLAYRYKYDLRRLNMRFGTVKALDSGFIT